MSALVLVADSDPFSLRLLCEVCESAGHASIGAASGEEVLDRVARDRPDLVLMDAGLPGMNGFEVLAVLKGERELARIPVLLAGDVAQTARVEEGLRLGALGWVAKPYRVAEVQRGIAEALAGNASEASGPGAGEPGAPGTLAQLHLSLEYEMLRAARRGAALGCIVFRLDGMTRLAEPGAETAMDRVHEALRTSTREVDQIFRIGRDEIALILPETDATGTRRVLERTQDVGRKALERLQQDIELQAANAVVPSDNVREGDELLALARSRL